MTDQKQKKQAETKSAVGPIVAGIAGVIAGGVAVATAVVMSDKKNQEKVKDVLVGVEEKLVEGKDRVEKVVNSAKDSLNSK